MLLSVFDPWKSPLCTCPPKLTFNPYTGCDHRCLYCYASSYIPGFFDCRPKKNLISRLKKETARLKGELVSVSNSSDPYPQLEDEMSLMRKCLNLFAESCCRIQIVTKSDLVVRDIDILQNIHCMVSLTILTLNDVVSKKLEPGAPVSSKRLEAIETLVRAGIPTSVRIDPIIPYVTDNLAELVEAVASLGVVHVTSSTYKVKPDNWNRFSKSFSHISEKLRSLYFDEGERIGNSTYLPKEMRFDLMKNMKRLVEKYGLNFSCCREGFDLNSAVCDGSWVINNRGSV